MQLLSFDGFGEILEDLVARCFGVWCFEGLEGGSVFGTHARGGEH